MLNRENAFEVSRQAYHLLNGSKFAVSRSLRRFLMEVLGDIAADNGTYVFQSFAFDEGYSEQQLAALAAYASRIDEEQQSYLEGFGAQRLGTQSDSMFGSVANGYKLPFIIATAMMKELQAAVKLVAVLSDSLHGFVGSPAKAAGFEDYTYRGLPCNIAPDEELWMVGGHDKRGGSGVLEWCYDEADARERLLMMQRYPERFINVKAEPYAAKAGMHWAVAEAIG
jgi:hypothetical protein